MHIALCATHSSLFFTMGPLVFNENINCRAFFFSPPPILFPCYWITNSVTSFVYTMLKAHSLFFCMPYFVLSSALLLISLLRLFQNQSRKSSCWPWYHCDNICFLLQTFTSSRWKTLFWWLLQSTEHLNSCFHI